MMGYAELQLIPVALIVAACAWSFWKRIKPKPRAVSTAVTASSGCGSCRQCPGQRCS